MIQLWYYSGNKYKKNEEFTKFTLRLLIFVLYFFTYFFQIMTPEAERFNGWAAMLGFVAAIGAYVSTGQIIPGWF